MAPVPKPRLSEDLKQKIIDAWQENPDVSFGALGERFLVSRHTVYSLIQRFKGRGTVANLKNAGIRKTSDRTDRLIVREASKNPFSTAR